MKPSDNADQIAQWNNLSGPRWVAQQVQLDAQLESLGEAALARLSPRPGWRVLDVGCGCGSTSLRLAQRVGPAGHVTGLDVSRVMLDRARERLLEDGVAHVAFVEADAQTHRFLGAPFDALYSRFGVMFFADPEAALRNLRAALAPGAPVAFVAWRPMALNPWMGVPLAAAQRQVSAAPLPPPPPHAPGPFGFGDDTRTLDLFARAGFVNAAAEPLDVTLLLAGGADLATTVEQCLQVGPCAAILREHPAQAGAVRDAVSEALRPYVTAVGVALPGAVWIYTARA